MEDGFAADFGGFGGRQQFELVVEEGHGGFLAQSGRKGEGRNYSEIKALSHSGSARAWHDAAAMLYLHDRGACRHNASSTARPSNCAGIHDNSNRHTRQHPQQ
jgi:hypothetical protein